MRMECIGGSVLGRSDGAFFGIYVMSSGHGSSCVSVGRWRMCDIFLGWCAHAAYMEIRASWFEQVKVKAQELTPALWKAIRAGLRCRDGAFKAVGSQPVEA